ncbi:DUF2796 domain-containing protein [Iodobacter fluviatilis]|uniref:Protein of uncharacterized function (DUF2796) n=1 Tax=Iodobacter fluviatilis TaxID=537 RepID=A0A377Q9H5_9NEIS|nr:DUF2796 domain-containing protein [Iodobacter fluviatilis]TCU88574.1 uncharacterized protein DUF2796 [Iodobacter fluviatilis]STQ91355.1 Protein of uncharacterised function (DUF2796) [Iodobacter fluviatilis]
MNNLLLSALLTLSFSGLASAHGAHVHGVAEMDVAIEGNKLVITLESPADNLLGFEHKPKNDTEKAKLKAVTEQLQNAGNLFAIDASAQCKAAAPSVKMPDFAKGGHSDIEAEYHFECAATPGTIALTLWKNFPGFKKITANLANTNGQKQITLKSGQMLNLK